MLKQMPINSQERKMNQGPTKTSYPFLEEPKDGSFESLPDTEFVKQVFNKLLAKFPEKNIDVVDIGSSGWQIKVGEVAISVGITALNTEIGAQNLNLRSTIKKSEYNQYPWLKEILDSITTEVVFVD